MSNNPLDILKVKLILSLKNRLRWPLRLSRLLIVFVLTIILFSISFSVLTFFPDPSTTIHISARTETLAYRVSNPTKTTIRLEKIYINVESPGVDFFDETQKMQCVTGELKLAEGVIVRYRRGGDDILTISIDGVNEQNKYAEFILTEGNGKRNVLLGVGSTFILNPNNPECTSIVPKSLPIWGPGEFGNEQMAISGPPNYLWSGKALIYARSISSSTPSLYKAGEIELPPGSRVSEYFNESRWSGPPLIGAAHVLGNDGAGFAIELSTESDSLRVYRAGASFEGYDTINVSLFARQFRDPFLQWVQTWIAVLAIIIDLSISLVGVFPFKDE